MQTLQQHFSNSFEFTKKFLPVYVRLLLIFIKYFLLYIVFAAGIIFVPGRLKIVFVVLTVAAAVYMVLKSVQFNVSVLKSLEAVDRGKTDAKVIWESAKGNFWKMFFLTIAFGVIVMIGMMLFIIPGIIFLVWYSFSFFAGFLRKQEVFDSLSFSKKLVEGNFIKVLVRMIIIFLIGAVLAWPGGMMEKKIKADVDAAGLTSVEEVVEDEVEMMVDMNFEVTIGTGVDYTNAIKVSPVITIFYLLYSLVVWLLFVSFALSYWYLLFKELEAKPKAVAAAPTTAK